MIGIGVGVPFGRSRGLAEQVQGMFANGERGYFFDPSNLSTMWQDTAATIPVTAPGQSVARINDLSGRGNYAIQPTALARPVLTTGAQGQLRLVFDGVDDFLLINPMSMVGTDKVTVCTGVLKSVDAAAGGVVCEHSANSSATAGVFAMFAPSGVAPTTHGWRAGGTTPILLSPNTVAAPNSSVITGIDDIAAPNLAIRRNTAQVDVSTVTQGTGGLTSQIHYIGARAGTSVFLNGGISALVCLGRTATPTELATLEAFANSRERAY